MAEIRWTDLAVDDLKRIAEYIAIDSVTFARIQTKRFFDLVTTLETQPLVGRMVPELNDKAIRELVMSNYRIIYLVHSPDSITILTIHHSQRLIANNPAFRK
jgi:addiction module RelE/StbE family toxin